MDLTVNFVLKFLHILGLMLGAAAGFGTMVVARQARRAGAPSPELMALRPHFATFGLAGIVLIWLSGLALWLLRYDLANLGPAYTLKLVVALVLLGVILAIYQVSRRAAKAGTPPPSWLPKLGMTTPILTLLAMGLGVWVFI
ncbi:hypothetical protein [Mesorhizobium sp. CAU 1741]|uniref:hypothetical protein n=1 Tax=Mesorhizobium sp. CAU 1741 TaxID=3140366 RepID=UPI00325AA3C9